MARGWESKSVEQQLDEAEAAKSAKRERLSPQDVERARRAEALRLARARVLQQLEASTSQRYTEMLQRQLEAIDGELKQV